MFDSTIEWDPHPVFPRSAQRYRGARKDALAQLAPRKPAEGRDPRRAPVRIHVRSTRQITIDRNLIYVIAQLPPALVEEGSGAQRHGRDPLDRESIRATWSAGR